MDALGLLLSTALSNSNGIKLIIAHVPSYSISIKSGTFTTDAPDINIPELNSANSIGIISSAKGENSVNSFINFDNGTESYQRIHIFPRNTDALYQIMPDYTSNVKTYTADLMVAANGKRMNVRGRRGSSEYTVSFKTDAFSILIIIFE